MKQILLPDKHPKTILVDEAKPEYIAGYNENNKNTFLLTRSSVSPKVCVTNMTNNVTIELQSIKEVLKKFGGTVFY